MIKHSSLLSSRHISFSLPPTPSHSGRLHSTLYYNSISLSRLVGSVFTLSVISLCRRLSLPFCPRGRAVSVGEKCIRVQVQPPRGSRARRFLVEEGKSLGLFCGYTGCATRRDVQSDRRPRQLQPPLTSGGERRLAGTNRNACSPFDQSHASTDARVRCVHVRIRSLETVARLTPRSTNRSLGLKVS